MEVPDIDRYVEALLFVADGPVSLGDLARALHADVEDIQEAMRRLGEGAPRRGLCVEQVGSRVRMVTAPDASPAIERFLGENHHTRLSAAALETLAIIAYRQPITRARIEAIRGVNSESVIRTLLARSLITTLGRLEQAGRPVLFGTTFEFLEYLGIQSLDTLPAIPELDSDDGDIPSSQ